MLLTVNLNEDLIDVERVAKPSVFSFLLRWGAGYIMITSANKPSCARKRCARENTRKSFMISKFALVATASLVLSFSAHAATVLTNSGGLITGATGVDVGGTSYDVAFLEGSCNSLFDGCTDFTFTTGAGATAASDALFDLVLTQTFPGILIPSSGVPAGAFVTPYSYGGGAVSLSAVTLVPWSFSGGQTSAGFTTGDAIDPAASLVAAEGVVYASWTPSSVVPLPAAAWLFISAIAGLAGAKRLTRSKRTA